MYSAFSQHTWKPRTSVKLRYAFAQGIFICVIIGTLAATLYFPVRQRFVNITNQSYKILAENLAASIYTDYQSSNRQGVINALRKIETQQGVKYVLVINKDGVVYYDTFSGDGSFEGKQFSSDQLTKDSANGNTAIGKIDRAGVIYYNYVAPFSSTENSYSVRLGIDQEIIDGQFIKLARLFLYMATFGVLIGIIAAYILASKLTKPIIKLTESALAIRAGNLSAYPEINTNDELEQLSREFQNMVEKLKQFYFQEFTQKREAVEAKGQLEEANKQLKQLDRQKSDFLNAASHQLRTPLSVIHWSLSLITEAVEKQKIQMPKDHAELLTESLSSTKRMVDLVNELLDISRIEQGRKELNWAIGNYGKVCEQLTSALQVLAQKKNLKLSYEQKGNIPDSYIDEKNLYQVVNNFVDNSIKYTQEGFVHVSCQRDGGDVLIRISDTGIGMSDEEKKNLFTRFSRGSDASKMFANGSGLGMYVAQSILKEHGGQIGLQSEKGRGTLFELRLPIYSEPPNKISPEKEKEIADIELENNLKRALNQKS